MHEVREVEHDEARQDAHTEVARDHRDDGMVVLRRETDRRVDLRRAQHVVDVIVRAIGREDERLRRHLFNGERLHREERLFARYDGDKRVAPERQPREAADMAVAQNAEVRDIFRHPAHDVVRAALHELDLDAGIRRLERREEMRQQHA